MDDILQKLQDVLRDDATLQTLLGGTAADPRVYLYYLAEALITEAMQAYITVALTNTRSTGAVTTPSYTVAIWARGQSRVEAVRDRIAGTHASPGGLLHKQYHQTDVGRRLYTKVVGEVDRFQPHPNFSGKQLIVQASWLEIP